MEEMKKRTVTVLCERAGDGYCSCYAPDDIDGCGLAGYGNSPEEAKRDFLVCYDEMREMMKEEGKEMPSLEFLFQTVSEADELR